MSRLVQSIIVAVALALVAPTGSVAVAQATDPPGEGGCPKLDLTRLHAPSEFRYGITDQQLQSDFLDAGGFGSRGYRPDRLAGVQDGNQVEFATRWVKVAGPEWKVARVLTGAQLNSQFLTYADKYRMTDLSGFNTPAGPRFNIIWERNDSGLSWRFYWGKTANEMTDLINTNRAEGYAPERIEGYRGVGGELRFVSTWVHAPRCDWQLHQVMTHPQYKDTFDDYAEAGYRQMQVDATGWHSEMWYHAIWWKQPGPGYQVRVDRDWYLFQQFVNNNWCAGFKLTNVYAADNGDQARYGGVWTFDTPVAIDDNSSLADQVLEEVNCAPGRGGAAVVDLHSGEQIQVHSDQTFGTSSTIKAAILYVLLNKLEDEGTSIMTNLDLPVALGSNQGPDKGGPEDGPLIVGNDETIEYLARIMIDNSNNWATNRLIQYIGEDELAADVMKPINEEFETLAMHRTRMNRYMTGSGSPSIHGTSGASGDYQAGHDNVTTPREFGYFLQLMHVNPGLLGPTMYAKYWELMGLNSGHDGALDDGVVDWGDEVDQFLKGGSNKWGWNDNVNPWASTASPGDFAHRPQLGSHVQRSEVGRLVFADGRAVVYATFFNDAANLPSYGPFDTAMDCIQVEVVRKYSGASTGNVLPQCK